ncbi:MAG: hypothetical protein ACRCXL_15330 [Dermatophilaceae bacterium]
MNHRSLAKPAAAVLAAFTVAVFTVAGCATGNGAPEVTGRWSSIPSPSVSSPAPAGNSTNATPSETVPAAVSRELDELARNLRDLSQAPSSHESMPAMSDALADARADLRTLRDRAYGTTRSCSAVAQALSSTRSDAARVTAAAATVRAKNTTRSALRTRGSATLERLTTAVSGGSRTASPDENAAVVAGRTALSNAAEQISRSGAAAGGAVATASDLVGTAEGIAATAC